MCVRGTASLPVNLRGSHDREDEPREEIVSGDSFWLQAHCQQPAPIEEKEWLNVKMVVGCRRVASNQPPPSRKRSGVWR